MLDRLLPVVTVSDEEVRSFYQALGTQLQAAGAEQGGDEARRLAVVRQLLLDRRTAEARQAVLERLRAGARIERLVPL